MRGLTFVSIALVSISSACGERSSGLVEPPLPRVASTRGGAVVLSADERVAVAAQRRAGVISIFHLDPERPLAERIVARFDLEGRTVPGLTPPIGGEGGGDGGDPPDEPESAGFSGDSEPWAATIGADDDTAYVVLRKAQKLVRVVDLHGTPRLDGEVPLGAEPTAIAITPLGGTLFVANYGEGTLSVISTRNLAANPKLDLNEILVAQGGLGAITPRPGLAHPRALALSDDGDQDETDETLYATEFFSQPLLDTAARADGGDFDRNRQGMVYAFNMRGRSEGVITLRPVPDTNFRDANGTVTGCFPNQLYAAALAGNNLFVTAMCASPRGPLGPAANNVKTTVHPAIFTIDTVSRTEPLWGQNLMSLRFQWYAGGGEPVERLPLIPNDLVFSTSRGEDGELRGYVSALGADAVFAVDYSSDGAPLAIGTRGARYWDLHRGGGTLPIGIALSRQAPEPFALVLNETSQNLLLVELSNQTIAHSEPPPSGEHARAVLDSPESRGRRLFATGLDVWSLGGQAWSSCEACHPEGQSDGVTWFFPRGPRRTISTAGTFAGGVPRVMLWTANIDEIHDVEVITRNVSGGVGGVLWSYETPSSVNCRLLFDGGTQNAAAGQTCEATKHTRVLHNGLNGSLAGIVSGAPPTCPSDQAECDNSPISDWNDIEAFIRSVRAPRAPTAATAGDPVGLEESAIAGGAYLFELARCAGCHGGPGFTLSRRFYTPGAASNGELPYSSTPVDVARERLGWLRTERYSVPEPLRALNPPGQTGEASLRTFAPSEDTDAAAGAFIYGAGKGDEQIQCVLRDVGTFPPSGSDGVTAPGAPRVLEVRQDMTTPALGKSGFNIPSLLGLATSAPYFHAGNARTLEEVFDPVFSAHYRALAPELELSRDDVRMLVSFLLSIDHDTREIRPPIPTLGFDPNLCPPAR